MATGAIPNTSPLSQKQGEPLLPLSSSGLESPVVQTVAIPIISAQTLPEPLSIGNPDNTLPNQSLIEAPRAVYANPEHTALLISELDKPNRVSQSEHIVDRLNRIITISDVEAELKKGTWPLPRKVMANIAYFFNRDEIKAFGEAKNAESALAVIQGMHQGVKLERSKDKGGHGGTFMVQIPLEDGTTQSLFLKPKDDAEYRHYQVIGQSYPELLEYMPAIHGEMMIHGKPYIIMENVSFNPNGKKLEVLADIKLAGRVEGLKNPIASIPEIRATERRKSPPDEIYMELTARAAGNFMIAAGGVMRAFNYQNSESNLCKILEGTSTEQIRTVIRELSKIQVLLESESCPFSLIGCSIILVKQSDNSIKPVLIDPAHMVISKTKLQGRRASCPAPLYFDEERFSLQKQSNSVAIRSLIESLAEIESGRKK